MSNLPYSKDNSCYRRKTFSKVTVNDSQVLYPPTRPSESYLKEQEALAKGIKLVMNSILADGCILYRNKNFPNDKWMLSFNSCINTCNFDYLPIGALGLTKEDVENHKYIN